MCRYWISGIIFFCIFVLQASTAVAQYKIEDLIDTVDAPKESVIHKSQPNYSHLSEIEKKVYDIVYPVISQKRMVASLPADMIDKVSMELVSKAVGAIMGDYPQFVWLKGCHFTFKTSKIGERIAYIDIIFEYNETASCGTYCGNSQSPTYNSLNDDEQKVYNILFFAISKKQRSVSFNTDFLSKSITGVRIVDVAFKAIKHDHSDLEWLKNSDYLVNTLERENDRVVVRFDVSFNYKNLLDDASAQDLAQAESDEYSSYYLLTEREKWLYDEFYPAVSKAEPYRILTPNSMVDDLDGYDVYNAILALKLDHPEFVWLETNYEYLEDDSLFDDTETVGIEFEYNKLSKDPEKYKREFEEAANKLVERASQEKTMLDKEKYIYDYILTQSSYKKDDDLDRSVYGILLKKTGVCEGYAITFLYFMKRLGIPAYYRVSEKHAWVIVNPDGNWYNVDATPSGRKPKNQAALEQFKKHYYNRPINGRFHQTPDDDFPNNRLSF